MVGSARDRINPNQKVVHPVLLLHAHATAGDTNVETKFHRELHQFKDILQSSTEEKYQKTTLKILMGYVWIKW